MKSKFTQMVEEAFYKEYGEYPVWHDGQPELKAESIARLKRLNAPKMIDRIRPATTNMGDMRI